MNATKKKLIYAADEFYKDPVFSICAVSLRESQLEAFNRRWDKLRGSVNEKLLSDAPRLKEHKRLSDGRLPEIHAVDMFQSESIYRLEETDPGYVPGYWTRQQAWIEEALKIYRHFQMSAFVISITEPQSEIDRKRLEAKKSYEDAFNDGKSNKKSRAFGNLNSNPYYAILPLVLSSLDNYNYEKDLEGEFIFDEFDHSKGFHEEDILKGLRNMGHIRSSYTSRHTSSEGNNLLQIADVVSYCAGRHYHNLIAKPDKYSPLFTRWFKQYILKTMIPTQQRQIDIIAASAIRGHVMDRICTPHGSESVGPSWIISQAREIAETFMAQRQAGTPISWLLNLKSK